MAADNFDGIPRLHGHRITQRLPVGRQRVRLPFFKRALHQPTLPPWNRPAARLSDRNARQRPVLAPAQAVPVGCGMRYSGTPDAIHPVYGLLRTE